MLMLLSHSPVDMEALMKYKQSVKVQASLPRFSRTVPYTATPTRKYATGSRMRSGVETADECKSTTGGSGAVLGLMVSLPPLSRVSNG